MTDCDRCDAALDGPRDKNSAGHYRDRCLPCIRATAPDVGRPRRSPDVWLRETPTPEGWDDDD